MADHWTTDDGLPLDHLNDLAVDRHGTAWIATYDGLVRFDGVDFHTFRPGDPEASGLDRILNVAVHPSDGSLWIIDQHGTLVRLSGEDRETLDPERWGPRQVFAVGPDALWLVTRAGLTRIRRHPEVVA
ncbi:MAG: hypothetical protein D6798_02290, partial [Deltaproteobacteria bacterium]